MDKQFDELSKSLAEGVSRRNALRRFGIGLAGVVLAAVGMGSSGCGGGASGGFLSDESRAPCPHGQKKCNGKCVDLSHDDYNCGSCDHVCGYMRCCSGGICVPCT